MAPHSVLRHTVFIFVPTTMKTGSIEASEIGALPIYCGYLEIMDKCWKMLYKLYTLAAFMNRNTVLLAQLSIDK